MTRFLPQARALANPREFARFLSPISPQRQAEVAQITGYDYRAHKLFFQPYFRGLLILFGVEGMPCATSTRVSPKTLSMRC